MNLVKITIVCFCIQLLMTTCKVDDTKNTASPQVSSDISESKKNGVFVKEYRIGRISFDSDSDRFAFAIDKMWVEKAWKYSYIGGIEKLEKFQLVIKPHGEGYFDSYLEDWGLCLGSDCSSGMGSGNIEKDISEISETMIFDIVKYSSKYEYNNYRKVGTLGVRKM